MASSTTLSTVLSTGVEIERLDVLNENIRSCMDDWEEFEDGEPILDFKNGKLLFRGFEEEEPVDFAEVWSSWTLKVSQLVSKHMVAGRLVLKLDHEFGKQEFHVLTPGKAVKTNQAEAWTSP